MIKAFMFDLDGTLIDENDYMSDNTIYALKKLKEKGYPLVVNSGRPVFLSDYVTNRRFGKYFFDYVYGNNGSEYFISKTKENDLLFYLDSETIAHINKLYDDDMFRLGIYQAGETNYFLANKEINNQEIIDWIKLRGLEIKVVDFNTLNMRSAKIICLHAKEDYDKSNEYIRNHQTNKASIYHSSFMAIEIVPKGISKSTAVGHFSRLTGIKPEEILAFGDSTNDIPMLEATTGVILANATKENYDKIKLKTKSVKEDGIYDYLLKNHYLD